MVVDAAKGLDSVELIMQLEDCFGISIPDKDAGKINTVGDLFGYLRQRASAGSSAQCLTAKAFYQLRRSLMTLTGRSRNSIRPQTSLEELLPETDRAFQWRELERLLGLKLPRLMRPGLGFALTLIASALAILSFAGLVGLLDRQYWLTIFTWPIVALALWRVAILLPKRKPATLFPGCATVGDLARFVWAKNCKLDAHQGASDQQIWEAIVNILSESAGMKASDITPELSFVTDIPGDL